MPRWPTTGERGSILSVADPFRVRWVTGLIGQTSARPHFRPERSDELRARSALPAMRMTAEVSLRAVATDTQFAIRPPAAPPSMTAGVSSAASPQSDPPTSVRAYGTSEGTSSVSTCVSVIGRVRRVPRWSQSQLWITLN